MKRRLLRTDRVHFNYKSWKQVKKDRKKNIQMRGASMPDGHLWVYKVEEGNAMTVR